MVTATPVLSFTGAGAGLLHATTVITKTTVIIMINACLNISAPLHLAYLALRAQPHEFQQVAAYAETRLLLQSLLKPVQFTVGEVGHPAAIATDQVVVMFTRPLALKVAAAGVAYMYLA